MRTLFQSIAIIMCGIAVSLSHAEEKKPETPDISGNYAGSTDGKIHLDAYLEKGKSVNTKISTTPSKDVKYFIQTIELDFTFKGKGPLPILRETKEVPLKEYLPNKVTLIYLNKEGEAIKVVQIHDNRPIGESVPNPKPPMPGQKN